MQRVVAAAAITTGVVAATLLFRRLRRSAACLEKYRDLLIPSSEQLATLKRRFIQQLENGLQQDVPPYGREMLMLPSYVTKLPNGDESGDVYALDLGGTNFRVKHVRLSTTKSKIDGEDNVEVSIPREVYTGSGTGLFDFLARATVDFINQMDGGTSAKPPVIGFCFSFALQQTAVNKGVLLDWTKGFTCTGVIGNDPVELLSQALERAGRPCRVLTLLNDTVGVLTAQRYMDPHTSIGVIVGTGTNACYVEKAGRVTKWKPDETHDANTDTIINIEWGAFDSASLPRCQEDWQVDALSVQKGKYLFEKLLSGLYLGEVARCILLTLAKDPELALFGSAEDGRPFVPAALSQPGSFPTSTLSAVVDDRSLFGSKAAAAMCESLGLPSVTQEARSVVRELCELVALRSAKLVAMGLSGILEHTGWTKKPTRISVAFDGGVYEKFRAYRSMLRRALRDQMGKAKARLVKLTLSHDGSCVGAAVLAAAAANGLL